MNEYIFLPNTINLDLASKVGIANETGLNQKFYDLYDIYYKGLEYLLDRIINLDFFEQEMVKCELNFVALDQKSYNIYHKNSKSSFIFIRNNVHLERLSLEEIEFLEIIKDDMPKLIDFINKTFKRVLYEEAEIINFGPPIPKYLAAGKSLVLELAHNEMKCKTVDELLEKTKFVERIKENIIKTGEKSGIPVSVIINIGDYKLKNHNETKENSQEIVF